MQSTNVYLLLFLASVNATKCRDSPKHQESEAPFDWKKEKQYLCQSHGGKKIPSQLLKKVRQTGQFHQSSQAVS